MLMDKFRLDYLQPFVNNKNLILCFIRIIQGKRKKKALWVSQRKN